MPVGLWRNLRALVAWETFPWCDMSGRCVAHGCSGWPATYGCTSRWCAGSWAAAACTRGFSSRARRTWKTGLSSPCTPAPAAGRTWACCPAEKRGGILAERRRKWSYRCGGFLRWHAAVLQYMLLNQTVMWAAIKEHDPYCVILDISEIRITS